MSDGGHQGEIDYLRFFGSNYLEYDFSKVTFQQSVVEHFKIIFTAENSDGLLWYGSDQKSVFNFLELKAGKFIFHILYTEPGKPVHHKYQLRPPKPVTDGKRHIVEIKRSRNTVSKVKKAYWTTLS